MTSGVTKNPPPWERNASIEVLAFIKSRGKVGATAYECDLALRLKSGTASNRIFYWRQRGRLEQINGRRLSGFRSRQRIWVYKPNSGVASARM